MVLSVIRTPGKPFQPRNAKYSPCLKKETARRSAFGGVELGMFADLGIAQRYAKVRNAHPIVSDQS
jgi:hypothetical protein